MMFLRLFFPARNVTRDGVVEYVIFLPSAFSLEVMPAATTAVFATPFDRRHSHLLTRCHAIKRFRRHDRVYRSFFIRHAMLLIISMRVAALCLDIKMPRRCSPCRQTTMPNDAAVVRRRCHAHTV